MKPKSSSISSLPVDISKVPVRGNKPNPYTVMIARVFLDFPPESVSVSNASDRQLLNPLSALRIATNHEERLDHHSDIMVAGLAVHHLPATHTLRKIIWSGFAYDSLSFKLAIMSCELVSFWFWSCKIAKVLRQCWGFVDVTWVGGHPCWPHNCSNTAKVLFPLFSYDTRHCWCNAIAGGIPHISGDLQPSLKTWSQDTWTTESRCGSCQGEQHLLGHLGQKILGDKLKYRDNIVKANPLRRDFELRC